jgi:hypothetical protein
MVFRLFDTKIQKNFYFLKKNKKTIRSVIKNAGKHSEGKSYSVQVLVGISAVCHQPPSLLCLLRYSLSDVSFPYDPDLQNLKRM